MAPMRSPISESISLKTMEPMPSERPAELEDSPEISHDDGKREEHMQDDKTGTHSPPVTEATPPSKILSEPEKENNEGELTKKVHSNPEKGSKSAPGGVRQVLKSGIFGGGSKTPTKADPTQPRATTAPRASLAPAKRSTPSASSLATSTSARVSTASTISTKSPARTSAASRPTSSNPPPVSRPPAQNTDKAVLPTLPARATATKPGLASSTVARRRPSSMSSKPTLSASTSTARAPRPSTTAKPASSSSTARMTTSNASRPTIKPEPLRPTTSTMLVTKVPSVISPTSSTSVGPKARMSMAPTGKPISKPATGRASIAMAGAARPAVAASKGRSGSTTSSTAVQRGGRAAGKEAELTAKVEELERRLTEEKMSYEERLAEISMERLQIEERHSQAFENTRTEMTASAERSSEKRDEQLAQIRESHDAELTAANEAADAVNQKMEERIRRVDREKGTLNSELEATFSLLSSAEAHLTSSATTVDSLRKELDQSRLTLAEQEASLAGERLRLQKELSAVRVQLGGTTELIDELHRNIADLECKAATLEARISELEGKAMMDADERAARLEAHNGELELRANGLKAEIVTLRERLGAKEGVEHELITAKKELGVNGQGLETLASEKEAISKDLENHKMASENYIEAVTKAKSDASRYQGELQNLRIAHNKLEVAHDELHTTAATRGDIINNLETEVANMTKKHDAKTQEIVEASDARIAELSAKLHEVDGLREKLDEAETEIAILQEARGHLERKRKELEEESERLEVQMDRAKREAKAKVESTSNFAMEAAKDKHALELAAVRSELEDTRIRLDKAIVTQSPTAADAGRALQGSMRNDGGNALAALHIELIGARKRAKAGTSQTNGSDHLQEEVERLEDQLERLVEGAGSDGRADDEASDNRLVDRGGEGNQGESRVASNEEDIEKLRTEMIQLQRELQDERAAKNNALAQLTARTPPTSPPSKTDPGSPFASTTKEDQNAKIAELEMTIKRLTGERMILSVSGQSAVGSIITVTSASNAKGQIGR